MLGESLIYFYFYDAHDNDDEIGNNIFWNNK